MVGLEVVLQDFGKVSKAAFALREKQRTSRGDADMSFAYAMALTELRFFDKDDIVWWDGREGWMPERPIGKPKDYLAIRDDYDALKKFMARILKKGRVHAGGGTHGDSSRETNCAEYIVWMHRNSENPDFKQNVERATLELLTKEFARDFKPFDFEKASKKATGEFETGLLRGDITKVFIDQSIGTTRWRYGLEHPATPEEQKFREWYDRELEPTIRPVPSRNNERCTHFVETSLEFQEAFKQRYLRRGAEEAATRAFSPQFNRLIGLLDVVADIGEHDPRFSDLYALLRQKAEERFMCDAQSIAHHYSTSDIYRSILVALSQVQQGTALESFWLDMIKNDKKSWRVIASVSGLLTICGTKPARRKYIPAVLGALQQRGFDMDRDYQTSGAGFLFDHNILDDVAGHITELCFARSTFHHLDKEAGTLDVLRGMDIRVDGSYDFQVTRYTPSGTAVLSTSFGPGSDRISDRNLERTVRAYVDEFGYKTAGGVSITSLEGRRISGDARIVDASTEADGQYEGFVGLNHTHFPFVYDAANGTLRFAEPESRSTFFGAKEGWANRRKGMDKIEKKIPYEQFKDITAIGQRVDALITERRKSYIGDALCDLRGKLSERTLPYLTRIVHGRLVQQSDGLVQ